MRAVIDTNVLLSGLLWRGPPHALIEQVRAGACTLVSSPALLAELGEVIQHPEVPGDPGSIPYRSRADARGAAAAVARIGD